MDPQLLVHQTRLALKPHARYSKLWLWEDMEGVEGKQIPVLASVLTGQLLLEISLGNLSRVLVCKVCACVYVCFNKIQSENAYRVFSIRSGIQHSIKW